jgi:hypothetical protein
MDTVAGRQALIAKLEDISAMVHHLEIVIQNMEKERADLLDENRQLRARIKLMEDWDRE